MPQRIQEKLKAFRIKPELPGGFRDYGPQEAIAKQAMIDTIRRVFESFGFDPLETSSVQRTEVLTGGEEDSGKIIFDVRGSRSRDPREEGDEAGMALRFDLTVPLARFVASTPEIPKPFKRYQIGNVWRGERQQAGRYREFTQADVDIVGSSDISADAEIAAVIYTAFQALGIKKFVIKYNNRKILNALPSYTGIPEDKLWDALRIIDKRDKIGEAAMERELAAEFGDAPAAKVMAFLAGGAKKQDMGEYEAIRDILRALAPGAEEYLVRDYALVRGLSYYTGSVFETILSDAPEIGSVAGGGRYDDLVAQFTGQKIPAVGISIGVDRLVVAMEQLGLLQSKETLTQVLILRLNEGLKNEYGSMARELREAGIRTAVYFGDDTNMKAQLAYALKKEIPYVVIYGSAEKEKGIIAIKNLTTREQKEIPRDQLAAYFKI